MNTREQFIELAHDNLGNRTDKYLVKRRPFDDDPFADCTCEKGDSNDCLKHSGSFAFLPAMGKGLKTSSDRLFSKSSDSTPCQFILTGMPSAGKTTELKRIAHSLASSLKEEQNLILHLCCLQNTSAVQRAIRSKKDLWDWIMKSHESRIIAEQRYSLREFIELHKKFDLKPIMLIDTVDLLIYGKIGGENSTIIEYWKEIIEELKNENWTVLWSCRRYEYKQMKMDFESLEKSLNEIELPRLDENEVKKIFATTEKYGKYAKAYFTALGLAFPIVVGYKLDPNKWTSPIERKYVDLHEETCKYELGQWDIDKSSGPIKWISGALDGKIATDFLYEGLIHKLIDHVQKLYHFDKENIIESWRKIELAFFDSAGPGSDISRIQVEAEVINSLSHKEHIIALVMNAKKFGILTQNKYESPYEMSHQLFAEYCVWKHREKSPNYSDWLSKFPSCLFRDGGRGNTNDAALEEGQRWFYSFILFNQDLAQQYVDQPLSGEWEKVGAAAARNLGVKKTQHSVDEEYGMLDNIHHIRNINSEKLQILKKVNNRDPFIVNGPPGVGKSHLSYVWIDKKAARDIHWDALRPNEVRTEFVGGFTKDKAYFMTLSQKLRLQMNEKVEEYYNMSPMPVDFESWAIPEYILRLEKVLGLSIKPFEFQDFEREWKKKVSGGEPHITHADKVGVQALWNEFENVMIGKFGDRMDPHSYVDSTELFAYSKDPNGAALAFANWAYSVGEKNQKSLAERAGQCIEKVLGAILNGTLAEKEDILSLQPNILVLDEIQDLPFQVILLMLIMQNGERDCVMMCGDDEQTLELIQFDWITTFTHISTAVHEILEDFPEDESVIRMVNKWGKGNDETSSTLKTIVEKNKLHLLSVERCVPEIVDFMKDSWKTSVSSTIDPFLEKDDTEKQGTAYIVPGEISKARANENAKNKIISGVNFYEGVTEEQLVESAREIYENGLDIAILLPNVARHKEFSEKLKAAEIKLDVWTPRLIKGLEYPIVIATNPWDITTKHFQNVVSRPELETWDDTQTFFEAALIKERLRREGQNHKMDSERNQFSRTKKAIELITKQRKRHANIMLSRAQNQLIVALLEADEKSQIFRTSSPEKRKTEKTNFPLSFVTGDNQKDQNHGINRLIHRLCLIILSEETEDDRKQISLKAGHIIQTLMTNKKQEFTLPFYLLERHPQMQPDLDPIKLFDGGIERFSHQIGASKFGRKRLPDKYSDLGIEPLNLHQFTALKELESYLDTISLLANIDGTQMELPVNIVQSYQSELNSYIRKCADIQQQCFDTGGEELTRDMKSNVRIISEYIKNTFFGGYYADTFKASAWIEHAQIIDLKTYEVKISLEKPHNNRFKMIPSNETFSPQLSKIPESMKSDFWEEGLQYLNNGKIGNNDAKLIAEHLQECLNGPNMNLPHQGVLFISKLITNLIRKQNCDIMKICRYCETLEQHRGEIHTPNLFEMLSKQDKKVLAQNLLDNLGINIINKCLINNSNGLYQIFAEYCFKQKSLDAASLETFLQFGTEMATSLDKENLLNTADTIWENKKLKQIKNHCLKVIQNPNFAKTFSPQNENYSFNNLLGTSSSSFGQSLRLDLNKVGKQNVIEFFISRSCNQDLIIISDTNNGVERRLRSMIRLLPFNDQFDSASWIETMNDQKFARKLIKIPYDSDDLLNLSSDLYFGRKPNKFKKQSEWNKTLIRVLENLTINNQLEQMNANFEFEHFSVFDEIFEGHELRRDVSKYIRSKLSDEAWRKEMISSGVNLKSDEIKGTILPHLTGIETIQLVNKMNSFGKDIRNLLSQNEEELNDEKREFAKFSKVALRNTEDALRWVDRLSQVSGFWDKRKRNKEARTLNDIIKSLEDRRKTLDKALKHVQAAYKEWSYSFYPNFLSQFVTFFHSDISEGKKRYGKKSWKLLEKDFLKKNYPLTYKTFYGSNSEDNFTYFTFQNWDLNIQISLITLLQSFGNEKESRVGGDYNREYSLPDYKLVRSDFDQYSQRHWDLMGLIDVSLDAMPI